MIDLLNFGDTLAYDGARWTVIAFDHQAKRLVLERQKPTPAHLLDAAPPALAIEEGTPLFLGCVAGPGEDVDVPKVILTEMKHPNDVKHWLHAYWYQVGSVRMNR